MAEVKQPRHSADSDVVVERARDFWARYNRPILCLLLFFYWAADGWLINI
jgi:hypothetical protein